MNCERKSQSQTFLRTEKEHFRDSQNGTLDSTWKFRLVNESIRSYRASITVAHNLLQTFFSCGCFFFSFSRFCQRQQKKNEQQKLNLHNCARQRTIQERKRIYYKKKSIIVSTTTKSMYITKWNRPNRKSHLEQR